VTDVSSTETKKRGYDKEGWDEILLKCRKMEERLKENAASLRRNSLAIAAGGERLRLQAQWLRNEHHGTDHSANVVCFTVPKRQERADQPAEPVEGWGEVIAFPGATD
jgi:hypothetical protein|tara:strand:+ start:2900 stop:3223 length:324 start_codon:yes stop_codon:yes gene_type:complete